MVCHFNEVLLDAVTTGTSRAIDTKGMSREHSVYIRGTGTITGGSVQIETASDPDYTGTWAPLGAPITVAAGETISQITGALGALRVRVTSNITGGGTVSARAVGN